MVFFYCFKVDLEGLIWHFQVIFLIFHNKSPKNKFDMRCGFFFNIYYCYFIYIRLYYRRLLLSIVSYR